MQLNDHSAKILIADTSTVDRKETEYTLRDFGYTNIDFSSTQADTIKKIGNENISVLIIDHSVCRGKYAKFMKLMFRACSGRYTPPTVIATSAVNCQSAFLEAMDAGAAFCILKHCDPALLHRRVRSAISERKRNTSGAICY